MCSYEEPTNDEIQHHFDKDLDYSSIELKQVMQTLLSEGPIGFQWPNVVPLKSHEVNGLNLW